MFQLFYNIWKPPPPYMLAGFFYFHLLAKFKSLKIQLSVVDGLLDLYMGFYQKIGVYSTIRATNRQIYIPWPYLLHLAMHAIQEVMKVLKWKEWGPHLTERKTYWQFSPNFVHSTIHASRKKRGLVRNKIARKVGVQILSMYLRIMEFEIIWNHS